MTNGIDISTVFTAIRTRLGFKNPILSGYNIVDATNATTTSGRYFGDFHPSVTIQNIKDTQEDSAISNTDFNTLLSDWNKSTLADALNAVFSEAAPIESELLFENCLDNLIPQPRPNNGDFVGVRFNIADGYCVNIDSAQLLFDADIASLNLYLFQEHKAAAVATVSVTSIVANELKIVDVNQLLSTMTATNKGGKYYFGYFQNDIGSARALGYAQEWETFKVFNAMTFKAASTGATTFNRFALNTSYANYGLNLQLSSYRDYTNIVLRQAQQFDQLRGMLMAAKCIEAVTNSNRSNLTQRIDKENFGMWYNDLNGTALPGEPFVPNLRYKIGREVKRLQGVFSQKSKNQIVTYGECD